MDCSRLANFQSSRSCSNLVPDPPYEERAPLTADSVTVCSSAIEEGLHYSILPLTSIHLSITI